jgi:hypothetical protein
MTVRLQSVSAPIVVSALAAMCVVRPLSAQVAPTPENRLTHHAVETTIPAQRTDAQNQCIGRAISGGLIVTVGSFLILKAVSSGPIADDSPPSNGVVAAISIIVGAGYMLWKSRGCENAYNGLPIATGTPVRREVRFSGNPAAGFDPLSRSYSSYGNAPR